MKLTKIKKKETTTSFIMSDLLWSLPFDSPFKNEEKALAYLF